ncbi:hypothetical protein Hamer_G009560, partial [Homarus americanus]
NCSHISNVLLKRKEVEDVGVGRKIQEAVQVCPRRLSRLMVGTSPLLSLSRPLHPPVFLRSSAPTTTPHILHGHSSVTTVTEKGVGLFQFEALEVCIILYYHCFSTTTTTTTTTTIQDHLPHS